MTATSVIYKPEDFGAIGDGITDNTIRLQNTVDACSENGGGRIVLAEGTYLTGTLELKSGVHLHLEKGSALKAIMNLDKYPEIPRMLFRDGCNETSQPEEKGYALLYTYRARNVRLSGAGVIDGEGERFENQSKRPFLIRVIESSSVRIEDVTLRQSGSWCCHLNRSHDVLIEGVTIRSRNIRNGDGIDIDGCRNVVVRGCDIRTNDDAVCFKSTDVEACQDVLVTDCVLESNCSGIKIGTESVGDITDVHVTGCRILNCGVVALKITPVDGGSVRNVTFSDLEIVDCTGPVFVACGNRGRRYTDEADPARRSTVSNLVFRDLRITTKRFRRSTPDGVGDDKGQGIVISGCPDQIIRDIRFEKIDVAFWGGIEQYDRDPKEVPFLTDEYPECYKLGLLPSSGFYFQYTEGVTEDGCTARIINHDIRPLRWYGPNVYV